MIFWGQGAFGRAYAMRARSAEFFGERSPMSGTLLPSLGREI